jgi:hypothetical protein
LIDSKEVVCRYAHISVCTKKINLAGVGENYYVYVCDNHIPDLDKEFGDKIYEEEEEQ